MELRLLFHYHHLVPRSRSFHMTPVGQRSTSELQGVKTALCLGSLRMLVLTVPQADELQASLARLKWVATECLASVWPPPAMGMRCFWEAGCVKDAAWQADVKEAINMPLVSDAGKFFLTWEWCFSQWCWIKAFQKLSGSCLREVPPTPPRPIYMP